MNQRLPVTIVTGFLGAGKTTLISNLISKMNERHFALIVNEFGEVSIDDALIRDKNDHHHLKIYNLTNGLVAYNAGDQFLSTMLSIWEQRRLFDHVIIETSGLALPTAILQALQSTDLINNFVLDATIAVIDTPWLLDEKNNTANTSAPTQVFIGQIEAADVVVLNKIDSLNETVLLQAEKYIREQAPNVRFLELAHQAQLDPRLTLGLRLNQPVAELALHHPTHALTAAGTIHKNGHSHSGLQAHDHGILTHDHIDEHDPGWMSFTLHSKENQNSDQLVATLTKIANQQPLLRTKGFIHANSQGEHILIQGVRSRVIATPYDGADHSHSEHDHSHHEHEHHDHHYAAELVFIGFHLNRESVLAILNKDSGTAWQ